MYGKECQQFLPSAHKKVLQNQCSESGSVWYVFGPLGSGSVIICTDPDQFLFARIRILQSTHKKFV
jgi:hypothetical protein